MYTQFFGRVQEIGESSMGTAAIQLDARKLLSAGGALTAYRREIVDGLVSANRPVSAMDDLLAAIDEAVARFSGGEIDNCHRLSNPKELLPMTYMEAVRTAEGYAEELGLVGHLSVTVSYNRLSPDHVWLEWRGYFSLGINLPSIAFVAPTAERMLTGFRLELLKLTEQPALDLASVGAPELLAGGE